VLRIPGAGSFNAGGTWTEGGVVNSVTAGIAILEGGETGPAGQGPPYEFNWT
jgi:hypothetical protein